MPRSAACSLRGLFSTFALFLFSLLAALAVLSTLRLTHPPNHAPGAAGERPRARHRSRRAAPLDVVVVGPPQAASAEANATSVWRELQLAAAEAAMQGMAVMPALPGAAPRRGADELPAAWQQQQQQSIPVLVTATNAYHFPLAALLLHAMEVLGLQHLRRRLVLVCLDDACLSLCREQSAPRPRCVLYPGPPVKRSDFGEGDYYRVLWIKWRVIQTVLATGQAALWLDDDVLVLRDVVAEMLIAEADRDVHGKPLPHLSGSGSGSAFAGRAAAATLDFQYQAERRAEPTSRGAGTNSCAAPPNGGLLHVRPSASGIALVDAMVAQYSAENATPLSLDQDLIQPTALAAAAVGCALPRARFAGHCKTAHESEGLISDLVTYHAHCCATVGGKLKLMQRILLAVLASRRASPEEGGQPLTNAFAPNATLASVDEAFLEDYDDVVEPASGLQRTTTRRSRSAQRQAAAGTSSNFDAAGGGWFFVPHPRNKGLRGVAAGAGSKRPLYSELNERQCFSPMVAAELRRLNRQRP